MNGSWVSTYISHPVFRKKSSSLPLSWLTCSLYCMCVQDDGICCNYGVGSYTIYHDGEEVTSGEDFGISVTETFGSLGPPPTPSPVTSSPTINPTQSPTSNPTQSPTHSAAYNEGYEAGYQAGLAGSKS